MPSCRPSRTILTTLFLGSASLLGACIETPPLAPVGTTPQAVVVDNPASGDANTIAFETLQICKVGSSADIFVQAVQPAPLGTTANTFRLTSGQCREAAWFDGSRPADLTASETYADLGYKLDSIRVYTRTRSAPTAPTSRIYTGTPTVSLYGTRGYAFVVQFFNSPKAITGCTRTQGYYKNHEDVVEALVELMGGTLFVGGLQLSPGQLDAILGTPPKGGNASLILQHQLIATKLNLLRGVSAPQGVLDAAVESDLTLVNGVSSGERARAIQLADALDAYNNGKAAGGPGHCG
ncbi:MAG: hypothetical protein WKG32_04390 [Gemmatimonadaceae bacterium]